ncbi:hypothetical protein MHJ96_07750 [Corynebacterium aurimucosum]|nr:hypothetical protein [Corynebacterium aurimucosum]
MTEPTREQILAAHRALAHLYNAVSDGLPVSEQVARSIRGEILAALPPRPQPTMAEIEWDNDVHYLAEAEHVDWGTMIMLKPMRAYPQIKCLSTEGGEQNCVYVHPDHLTPTGRRYTLTEVQE